MGAGHCLRPGHRVFAFRKIDAVSKRGLPGALFQIQCEGQRPFTALSDHNGMIRFCILPYTQYQLTEITPPSGYQLAEEIYQVSVDWCGNIFVDSVCRPVFEIPNTRAGASISFSLEKQDFVTKLPLAGVRFVLNQGPYLGSVACVVSDALGKLYFEDIQPGNYQLKEVATPCRYQKSMEEYRIIITEEGDVFVDGRSAEDVVLYNLPKFCLAFPKIDDESDAPIAGAEFTLYCDGNVIDVSTSDETGTVDFGKIAPGNYTMSETNTLPGYFPHPNVYPIKVSCAGEVIIDGVELTHFQVRNREFGEFYFTKTGEGVPLGGAIFTIFQNDVPFITVESEEGSGLVSFGILQLGTYVMEEIEAPDGFEDNTETYTVLVSDDGIITVNDIPLEDFSVENTAIQEVSPAPFISDIFTTNIIISGFGIAGSTITLTFPNGEISETIMEANGTWIIPKPPSVTLLLNDIISAYQTSPGMLSSEVVTMIVRALD